LKKKNFNRSATDTDSSLLRCYTTLTGTQHTSP